MYVVTGLFIGLGKRCHIFRTTVLGAEGDFPPDKEQYSLFSHCINVSSIKLVSHSEDATFTAGIILVSVGLKLARVIGNYSINA